MSGYVPPHLRGKAASGESGPPAAASSSSGGPPPRSGSYGELNRSGSSRGGNWGDERGSGGGGGGAGGGGSFGRREPARRGPIDPVFVEYSPSDRVKALTEDMVADIRQRLNVTVEVPEGAPPAAAPVESFRDMVRDTHAAACIIIDSHAPPCNAGRPRLHSRHSLMHPGGAAASSWWPDSRRRLCRPPPTHTHAQHKHTTHNTHVPHTEPAPKHPGRHHKPQVRDAHAHPGL